MCSDPYLEPQKSAEGIIAARLAAMITYPDRTEARREMRIRRIYLIILVGLVVVGVVVLSINKQQSNSTGVMTTKIVRQDLWNIVSGTGQIKPKTYVNVGANSFGRITRLTVKEGDRVTKGEVVATVESVEAEASVDAQKAAISAAGADIASYVAAEETAKANVNRAKADLEQKSQDWERARELYAAGILAKQDFDAKKEAYDADAALLSQMAAAFSQARAQTDSARGHLQTQVANLHVNQDMLDKTIAIAPFNSVVTNLPVREGETVVTGIQNTEGSTLMTLADLSIMTAEVKVDETDIVNVQIGQSAEVTVDAIPGKVFKGHVTLIGDQALLRSTGMATLRSTTGTEEAKDFKVTVTLDSPSNELRPGLSATAAITTAHKNNVLALPIQAIIPYNPESDNAPYNDQHRNGDSVQAASSSSKVAVNLEPVQGVFVVENAEGKPHTQFVHVTTGITSATEIEVTSGLNEGQEIVIGPFKVLRDLKSNVLVKCDVVKPLSVDGSS